MKKICDWLKWVGLLKDDWNYFDGFKFLMQFFELLDVYDEIINVRFQKI